MKLVLYTHTDCKDIWPIFFGQTKKYVKDIEKIIIVDKIDKDIPDDYKIYQYDENYTYTERLVGCLAQLDNDIIIFQHEDMILYDFPMMGELNKCEQLIKDKKVDFIKLIRAIDDTTNSISDNVYLNPQNSNYGFCVQPSICESKTMVKMLIKCGRIGIWELEETSKNSNFKMAFTFYGEEKRGIHHYNSNIYPYIATAINKGKWNYSEYKKELDLLFDEYNIDKNVRGVV